MHALTGNVAKLNGINAYCMGGISTMSDAGRFAFVIALFFVAMVCFFFTFHPGGVVGVSSPQGMLQWLFGAFNTTTGADAVNNEAQLTAAVSGGASEDTSNTPNATAV
jgi:hypothetical protein